jgi:integrase
MHAVRAYARNAPGWPSVQALGGSPRNPRARALAAPLRAPGTRRSGGLRWGQGSRPPAGRLAENVADLTEVPDGLRILIRRSKGDQEGQGQEVAIPRGYKLRPVEAVQAWLAAAEISAGPVFRAVSRGGRVSCEALAADSAARIVQRYARRIGLDPASYAGHSLRSGFLTSAAEGGASIWKMAAQSRHKSLDTLRGYIRNADLFKEHAGAAFL